MNPNVVNGFTEQTTVTGGSASAPATNSLHEFFQTSGF